MDKLVHHVQITGAQLSKALKLFKLKRHAKEGFYFEVEQLEHDLYIVKVYKEARVIC